MLNQADPILSLALRHGARRAEAFALEPALFTPPLWFEGLSVSAKG